MNGVVTPTLMLGPIESAAHLTGSAEVDTPEAAVAIIDSGGIAILPPGAWEAAAETLRLLGADDAIVEDRIHFAKTGQVLHAV